MLSHQASDEAGGFGLFDERAEKIRDFPIDRAVADRLRDRGEPAGQHDAAGKVGAVGDEPRPKPGERVDLLFTNAA